MHCSDVGLHCYNVEVWQWGVRLAVSGAAAVASAVL